MVSLRIKKRVTKICSRYTDTQTKMIDKQVEEGKLGLTRSQWQENVIVNFLIMHNETNLSV